MTRSKNNIEKKEERLNQVCDLSDSKLSKAAKEQTSRFLRLYYKQLTLEELIQNDIEYLRGAAIQHYQEAKQRKPDTTKVRVYNPQFEKHGWQSTHTIIEIITDDKPFLINSISMALSQLRLAIHMIVHPILSVTRNTNGKLASLAPKTGSGEVIKESFMQFQIDRQTNQDILKSLEQRIRAVIQDVNKINHDWQAMLNKTLELKGLLPELSTRYPKLDIEEAETFLAWLCNNHFTFLGYCELVEKTEKGERSLSVKPETTLGLLNGTERSTGYPPEVVLPLQNVDYIHDEALITICKSNAVSTVHRGVYMDFITIPKLGAQGHIMGRYCLVGLLASSTYSRAVNDIPYLRKKFQDILVQSGLDPQSHAGRALSNTLENYPRDALFQQPVDDTLGIALGIMALKERQRIRLFVQRDVYGRFYTCIVYIPSDRYSRELREAFQKILVDELNGEKVEYDTQFSTHSTLARVCYTIHTAPNQKLEFDRVDLEQKLAFASRAWHDDLQDILIETHGEELGNQLFHDYRDGIHSGYKEDFSARVAAYDIDHLRALKDENSLEVNFYRPLGEEEHIVNLKVYHAYSQVLLSEIIPVIENMGLKVNSEKPYAITRKDGIELWIHEFVMQRSDRKAIPIDAVREKFQDAFIDIWTGRIENDGFNQLVLTAGLSARKAVMLRAYCKYLSQIRVPFSQNYMINCLTRNPAITSKLVELFSIKFNPKRRGKRDTAAQKLVERIHQQLEDVSNLDEDRILRGFLNLIESTLRTNYYQKYVDKRSKEYLSFKFDPNKVYGLPLPKPMFEIFVVSPRVEAVHLRGGKVARGGLRWSDRLEDFRTEVLGLVKAQMVKNAVIVPVGSKGGFVVKKPPINASREEMQREVEFCYTTFLRGMLDITDNYIGGQIVPPTDVIRYDEDDPYLVIAADKGTATFSDLANSVAKEYGFWLDDAFASGGSQGYDHKKMGITARGAWESVKRHFRELGLDTQSEPFTVIGIGDMGGDVFGNGMLLSKHIKLVAAFNHQHIFLDPDPDPASSYEERERLFHLPRSTWEDYDKLLISKGGGIYSRSSKSIAISPEIQALLDTNQQAFTPAELIHTLLKAPVDLLWNGGIGTYVKSASEADADVHDRVNDSVRVNGGELRCRVIGEGGNLGFTQLGRIEFALSGGKVNTDAIDNSAGVDCSDHEVNIKILLHGVLEDGDMTTKQRNKLLSDMTDEVATLVLRNNYQQTQAISIAESEAVEKFQEHSQFMTRLESEGKLNRALEFLPNEEAIAERLANNKGLTRPELSVIFAYSKMHFYHSIVASELPDDPYLNKELDAYFPERLCTKFRAQMNTHRLKREIIATHVTNQIINRTGPTYVNRAVDELACDYGTFARAHTIAHEVFAMDEIYSMIESLDNKVPAAIQTRMLTMAAGLVERSIHWLIRNHYTHRELGNVIGYFEEGVNELIASMPRSLAADNRETLRRRVKFFLQEGVPREITLRIASVVPLSSALDIVDIARTNKQDVKKVATLYFNLGYMLDMQWLRDQISALKASSHWHMLAKSQLRSDLHLYQHQLVAEALNNGAASLTPKKLITNWFTEKEFDIQKFKRITAELRASSSIDFAMLSVAVSESKRLLA
ncbi:MAG: NAD-glutamate dehydrogenase [Gammaproteobacteria bacterium]|nr:NAD-glutamate dehydrogenase [Gammaproteobacteria bacterium]